MNIQSVNNNNNIAMQSNPFKKWKNLKNKVVQKTLDFAPLHTALETPKLRDRWNKIDDFISKPMQNRAILGITALMTQPFIDYLNPKIDDETREIAFFNRVGVIIPGMLIGMFVVRGPVHKAIEKMTNINSKSKLGKLFIPKQHLKEFTENEKFRSNYCSALAMSIILCINGITNFILDLPASIMLTNYLKKHFGSKDLNKIDSNLNKVTQQEKEDCDE